MKITKLLANSNAAEPTARGLWSAIDAGANPLSMLLMLAGLVRTLGAADYGILMIALAASGITMATNPAIATTTTKFVSEAVGRLSASPSSVSSVVTAALTAALLIDAAIIACTVLWRDPLSGAVFGASIDFANRNLVLLLSMVAVAIQQLDTVIGAAIRGLERFRRQALIELAMRATLTIFVIVVSWRTRSVIAVLIAQCAVFASFAAIRTLALRELLPGRRLIVPSSPREAASLLRYGSWMWLSSVAGVTYTVGDRILVGRALGAAAAGEYSIYVQLTQLIHFLPSSLFAFSLPAFSRLSVDGKTVPEAKRAYRSYVFSVCVIAGFLAIALLGCWPMVMRLFASAKLPANASNIAILLLAVNFFLLAVSVVPYYLLLAFGKSKLVSLTTSIWMCAALLLMAMLIPRYGLAGAAGARLAYSLGSLTFLAAAERLLKSR